MGKGKPPGIWQRQRVRNGNCFDIHATELASVLSQPTSFAWASESATDRKPHAVPAELSSISAMTGQAGRCPGQNHFLVFAASTETGSARLWTRVELSTTVQWVPNSRSFLREAGAASNVLRVALQSSTVWETEVHGLACNA